MELTERPTVGTFISRTMQVLRDNPVPLLGITAMLLLPYLALTLSVSAWVLSEGTEGLEEMIEGMDPTSPAVIVGVAVAIGAVFLLAGLNYLASASVVYGVFQTLRGLPWTIGACIRVALSRWWALLVLAFLVTLATMVGFMLCIIPGIVLTCQLFIVAPALLVEKLSPVQAMRRSTDLTVGHRWHIFALVLLVGVLQSAASGVLENVPFGPPAVDAIVTVLGDYGVTVASTLFQATAMAVVYHDLRVFREDLGDEELAAVFD